LQFNHFARKIGSGLSVPDPMEISTQDQSLFLKVQVSLTFFFLLYSYEGNWRINVRWKQELDTINQRFVCSEIKQSDRVAVLEKLQIHIQEKVGAPQRRQPKIFSG